MNPSTFDTAVIEEIYQHVANHAALAWAEVGLERYPDPEAVMLASFVHGLTKTPTAGIQNMVALCHAELTARGAPS